jgi:hypothetical protein
MSTNRKITIPIPNEHPLRGKLRQHKLSIWQLSSICDVSRGYMSAMLVGTSPMAREIQQKLEDLLKQLEAERG